MSLNRKKFLQGAVIGILIVFLVVFGFSKAKANEGNNPWQCSRDSVQQNFVFTNTSGRPQLVQCKEFINCHCPGESHAGICNYSVIPGTDILDPNAHHIIERTVWGPTIFQPGQSGSCTFRDPISQLQECAIHQSDIWVAELDGTGGSWVNNCWYLADKCSSCNGVTPTITPTPTEPISTPTPTPTQPIITPTPTPPAETACWKECDGDDDCEGDNICQEISGTKRCLNPKCETESDCTCNKNCWAVCGHDSECPSGLSCKQIDDTKRCVKSECDREQDCNCAAPTLPPVLGEKTPAVLPAAGFGWDKYFLLGSLALLLRFLAAGI